jgi:hypothetical protein
VTPDIWSLGLGAEVGKNAHGKWALDLALG